LVAGQGTWAYDPMTGLVTFTPEVGFNLDPTPIPYTLTEIATGLSDPALITVDYIPVTVPNEDVYLTDTPKIVSVLTNDTGGDTPVATTISITGGTDTDMDGDLDQLVVTGQGTWQANPDGTITFTPEMGYTGNPTPITYTVMDDDGNTSNASTVTLRNSLSLPVDLISFDGKQFEDQVILTWKVANEKDFSHFELERSQTAKEFGSIATINASKKVIYNYNDLQPNEGDNYYRLKMVDLNGTSTHSKIVNISFEKNGSFIAVENPAKNGEFKVMTNMKNAKFTLVNGLGVRISTNTIDLGRNSYQIIVNQATSGMYFLIVESNGKLQTKKVLIP
jgi:CshA-type fibril repeat protein